MTDTEGETALFYAVRGANASLVRCLVQAMSETTRAIVNKQGLSARDLCEHLFSEVDERKGEEEEEEEQDDEEKEKDESEVSVVLRTMREFCKTDLENNKFDCKKSSERKEAAFNFGEFTKRNSAMKSLIDEGEKGSNFVE